MCASAPHELDHGSKNDSHGSLDNITNGVALGPLEDSDNSQCGLRKKLVVCSQVYQGKVVSNLTDEGNCGNMGVSRNLDPLLPVGADAPLLDLNYFTIEGPSPDGITSYDNFDRNSKFSGTYTPVIVEPGLEMFPFFIANDHYIGACWLAELAYENDAWLNGYIKKGVLYGFDIIDNAEIIDYYDRSNYFSVQNGPTKVFIDNLIQQGLFEGKYIYADSRPKCIHSLGVVPKAVG